MYKGLATQLEETVNELKIGNAVLIEYKPNQEVDRVVGYIHEIKADKLNLRPARETHSPNANLANWINASGVYFKDITSIKIID